MKCQGRNGVRKELPIPCKNEARVLVGAKEGSETMKLCSPCAMVIVGGDMWIVKGYIGK